MILFNLIAFYTPNIGEIIFPAGKSDITDLSSLIMAIINWLFGIAGALAVIAIIYSGIMYITASGDIAKAGGNPTQAMKAKKNLTWAIIGIVVLLGTWFIVNQIGNILGG